MKRVTIKGQEYSLGDIAFSEENVLLFERLMAVASKAAAGEEPPLIELVETGFIREFQRVLRESLTSGNGEEKAAQAIRSMAFRFGDGDLMNAFQALMGVIGAE